MSSRARAVASTVLLVAGVLALTAGLLASYANDRIVDGDAFADEAVATLDDAGMRRFVASRLTDRVIERVDPDLVAFNPLIESAVGTLLDTQALRGAIRRGILAAHRAVFDRGVDDAVITAADVGALVRGVLREVDPALAKEIPPGFDARLVRLADAPAAVEAAQLADGVGRAAALLPPLGILLITGSALVAVARRRAAVRAGTALLVTAAVLLVAITVLREALLDRVDGETARAAAASVWDAFAGGLDDWFAYLGGVGVALIVVATFSLAPSHLTAPLRSAWRRVGHEPSTRSGRLAWSAGLAAVGIALVLAPERMLRLALVLTGIYLMARALAGALGAVAEARGGSLEAGRGRGAGERPGTRRALLAAGIAAVLAAICAGVGLSLLIEDDDAAAPAARKGQCNGAAALCDRPLDRVAFLATHNSYAGTGYPDFLFPAQEGTIGGQLEDGVRGLWIDTYYGAPGRRVFTLTDRIDPALNAQLKAELGPRFQQAAENLRARIAKPPAGEKGRIYLCHGYCELGAVDARDAFAGIADFLERNPDEVLIIDIEDYTVPAETAALIESSGLGRHVYRGPAGPPWPSLGEMIGSGGRVLVVAEHRTGGAPSWYRRAYSLFQETPFSFRTPAEMSCAPNRGSPGNSLFLINHWINTDPTPKPSKAAVVNAYPFLLDRARRCERRRGRFPNVLSVDFYRDGDAARVVQTLNGGSEGRG
jgi:hypothetical protein